MKSIIIPEIGTDCKICGKHYNFTSTLSPHVKTHGIELNEYYEKYINPNEDIYCPYCGKERKINSRWWWRQKTCGSNECMRLQNSESNKDRWGDEEYRKSQISKYKEYWSSDEGKEMAKIHAVERFEKGIPSAYNGVKTMHKHMFEDSNYDKSKFKSLRLKFRNSYVTYRGEDTLTDLYLVESLDTGLIKVGITKDINSRFKPGTVKIIDYVTLPTPKSADLELQLMLKYFDHLIDRSNSTKSEWIDSNQKDNLKKDFSEIHKGIF